MTLSSKVLHFFIMLTKSLNTKRFFKKKHYELFSKCEIQEEKIEGDRPDGELLIQVVQFLVQELEFHFRRWCIYLYFLFISDKR